MKPDKELFADLLGHCLQGMLANPSAEFRGNHSPVGRAMSFAEQAFQAIGDRFPEVHINEEAKRQHTFAKRIETENGNGR